MAREDFAAVARRVALLALPLVLAACAAPSPAAAPTAASGPAAAPAKPAAPAPAAPNPAAGARPAQDWLLELKRTLDDLPLGRMTFNPPSEMTVGEPERVELRVSRDEAADLTKGLKGEGTPETERIEVGTFMTARLSGQGFAIDRIHAEEQFVGDTGFAQWAWDVTATEPGDRSLRLVVAVKFKLDGQDVGPAKEFPVVDRRVTVRANLTHTVGDILKNNWLALMTGVALPVVLVFIKPWSRSGDGTEKRRPKRRLAREGAE